MKPINSSAHTHLALVSSRLEQTFFFSFSSFTPWCSRAIFYPVNRRSWIPLRILGLPSSSSILSLWLSSLPAILYHWPLTSRWLRWQRAQTQKEAKLNTWPLFFLFISLFEWRPRQKVDPKREKLIYLIWASNWKNTKLKIDFSSFCPHVTLDVIYFLFFSLPLPALSFSSSFFFAFPHNKCHPSALE